jgi:hypothetical protein
MALRKLQFSGELLLFERVEASPGSRHDAVDILASISVGKLLVEIGCSEATSNALRSLAQLDEKRRIERSTEWIHNQRFRPIKVSSQRPLP